MEKPEELTVRILWERHKRELLLAGAWLLCFQILLVATVAALITTEIISSLIIQLLSLFSLFALENKISSPEPWNPYIDKKLAYYVYRIFQSVEGFLNFMPNIIIGLMIVTQSGSKNANLILLLAIFMWSLAIMTVVKRFKSALKKYRDAKFLLQNGKQVMGEGKIEVGQWKSKLNYSFKEQGKEFRGSIVYVPEFDSKYGWSSGFDFDLAVKGVPVLYDPADPGVNIPLVGNCPQTPA